VELVTTPAVVVVADDGSFTMTFVVPTAGTLTVNYTFGGDGNAYVTGCTGGEIVVLEAANVTRAAAAPAASPALAFTGSSNTPSYVLIGIAALVLVLGAVLVVAARRRSQVS
jgi:LPXTG-motif cell wall-anchored protein